MPGCFPNVASRAPLEFIGYHAVARSSTDVEPFQRGWRRFQEEQEELARVARRKDLASNEEPSLWLTYQVQRRMADIANDAGK